MRIAWITGGGTGIGKALAKALYLEGWNVVISGRRADTLTQAADEITALAPASSGRSVSAYSGDVSAAADVQRIASAIHQQVGPVDLLVNNAGANPYHAFSEATPDEFEEYFRINCLSAIRCAKAVLPGMRERNVGAIVNVSSILGKIAAVSSPAYTVGKFALTGFTDCLRQDVVGSGIHVMGVYPGFIRTDMTLPFVSPGSLRARMGKSPEAMAAAILKGLRRKRRDVFFPWYVPLAIALHHWFPGTVENWRRKIGR
jgi:NAD(P)-dependent dehydrogenase (short-subunit alcohol dehydrogenase family)